MSFRDQLFTLLDAADRSNIERLRTIYPMQVHAWEVQKGFGPVTVITADGTGTGYLQSDDSITMVKEDEHLEQQYEDRFSFYEEEHPDDPSLQDTEFDHADPHNR